MTTLEEMTTWSVEDIRTAIVASLPKDLHFSEAFSEGFWTIEFWRVDEETSEKVVLWTDVGPDHRITLFNAYGWLWMKKHPSPEDTSPWRPRKHEVTARDVWQKSRREIFVGDVTNKPSKVNGPEDLDPEEVLAVYRQALKR